MVPTNEVMKRYFNDPQKVDTLGRVVRRDIASLAQNGTRLGIRIDNFAERITSILTNPASGPASVRSVFSNHMAACIRTLDPAFEVSTPPVMTAEEASVFYRKKVIERNLKISTVAAGLGGLALFEANSLAGCLIGGAVWMMGSAYLMKKGISLAMDIPYRSPAAYNDKFKLVIFNPEYDPRLLELLGWHESTHAVQDSNPAWKLGPMHKAYMEGQATDVEHQHGMSSEDEEVRFYTLFDRSCLLLPCYLTLADAHRQDTSDFDEDPWTIKIEERSINWFVNPLHCIGASVFSVARELKELPTNRDILNGNFSFLAA